MGAARLLRAVMELLAEALAGAWAAGSRSGVNMLLLPRPASAGWHAQAVGRAVAARLGRALGVRLRIGRRQLWDHSAASARLGGVTVSLSTGARPCKRSARPCE
jgi:hypothetical protein